MRERTNVGLLLDALEGIEAAELALSHLADVSRDFDVRLVPDADLEDLHQQLWVLLVQENKRINEPAGLLCAS